MSIHALPQSAVRTIGASQVLTDPSTVVKELIDNALDAGASIISVEVHANTLDALQVRDNGHGIAPQDRPLVARRHCTSKIISEDDLSGIGGTSLGFRGEALASAAEMSGSLTITTRVEGEQVATALRISQQGEVVGQDRASAPIGTTVKITDFCKGNPVRRQLALKQADQCLSNVKLLLKRYAFARPSVRLSLKVLKAKNDKGNWMYGPKPGGNAEDAAFNIVGAACASQCIWSVVELHGFTVQAFLPKVDAAIEKISNVGAFLCIDGRPMNPARGVAKQIIKDFRAALVKADVRFEGVKSPFLYMDIRCPEQSYDVNIEPAKDDVLFEDTAKVVEAATELFHSVYAPTGLTQTQDISMVDEPDARMKDRAVGLYEHRVDHRAHLDQMEDLTPYTVLQVPHVAGLAGLIYEDGLDDFGGSGETTIAPSKTSYRANMYGCDEEDLDALQEVQSNEQSDAEIAELRAIDKDVTILNPWVLARMHARPTVRPSGSPTHDNARSHADSSAALGDEVLTDKPTAETAHLQNIPGLLTPRASSPRPARQPFHPSDFVPDIRFANDGRLLSSEPSYAEQVMAGSTPTSGGDFGNATPASSQFGGPFRPINQTAPDSMLEECGTPLAQIPQARARGRAPRARGSANRPFVAPTVVVPPKERVWFDHLDDVENSGPRHPRRAHAGQPQHELVLQGELGNLIDDPQPLNRPTQNRDIRDFVESVDLTGGGSLNTVMTRGSEVRESSRRSDTAADSPARSVGSLQQDENTTKYYGALSGRGFMPASELATLEALGFAKLSGQQPPTKRRKTAERSLRPTSGNVPSPLVYADEDDFEPPRPRTKSGRRRSSVKLPRTKSSILPLERTPAGKSTYDHVVKSDVLLKDITAAQSRCDVQATFLPWDRSYIEADDIFVAITSRDEISSLASKVYELLINRVNDSEMVQDLGELISAALQLRQEAAVEETMSQSGTQISEV